MPAKLTMLEEERTKQPPPLTLIDWGNPITDGLVFCAVPFGASAIDLVTGVVGTVSGSVGVGMRSPKDGASKRGEGLSTFADGASGSYIVWPVSSTLRGATMGPNATILVLGGTTEQVDGKIYQFGGNTELINGWGYSVGIDSYLKTGRGLVTRGSYSGSAFYASTPNAIANPFDNRTHFFGYACNSNGVNGTWFLRRQGYGWAGQSAMGVELEGRKAIIHNSSSSGTNNTSSFNLLTLFWDRELSLTEYQSLYDNPWQIFEPEEIPLFKPVVTAQYARPTSDVSSGTWTASTGSDLFATLDETSANDGDYITTTSASVCEVALGSLTDPASSTGHIVRYRISATGGGIIVRLREGTTTIASWTHDPAPGSLTTYAQTLSGGEADSITDYTALKLQFEAIA